MFVRPWYVFIAHFFIAHVFVACATPANHVEITALADGVWLHRAMKDLPGIGPFPTHGLIARTGAGIILVDSAWDDEQTQQIATWVEDVLSATIAVSIHTHAHDDKMGGIGALHALNVSTYASAATNSAAPQHGLLPAKHDLSMGELAGGAIEVFYPGPAHSADNIVVYLKSASILFGGCLVRPAGSSSLGNTADANIEEWARAVERIKTRYPDAKIVVPSHGPPGGPELLDHTIALVQQHRARR
jgi:glyoxylase-like metal-dependent hydrolase (beta-lactamase superfamily II)